MIDNINFTLKNNESIKKLIKKINKKNISLLSTDRDLEIEQMTNLIK